MKVDLHCHCEASHDAITPIEKIPELCRDAGIRVQAITDHDQIWGAVRLRELVEHHSWDLTVIVGEEVSTVEGEIIGLFLKERVPPRMSPEETVAAIKEQGGLVLIPHGFDPLKRHRLKDAARERIADSIDLIEGFNARISQPKWNRAAIAWADERKVLKTAGSDSHRPADIGCAWVDVPDREVRGPEDLMEALRGASPTGTWTHPVIAFVKKVRERGRLWGW